MPQNKEPFAQDFEDLYKWIEATNTTPITNDKVINFFRQIFQLLEENNTCFASGAFVFENYGNTIFNLLTYNKLLIDSDSYDCDNPLTITSNNRNITPDPNVHIIGTLTHKGYYTRNNSTNTTRITPHDCMPTTRFGIYPEQKLRTKTKFERVFIPKITNICGYCKKPLPEGRIYSEPKGVILYYPFTVTSANFPRKNAPDEAETTTKLLFIKFEGAPVTGSTLEHSANWIKRHTGRQTQLEEPLPTRREDEGLEDYEPKYKTLDENIYKKYCPEDIDILEWYNNNVRTGCEFFVSRGLLTYFFKYFLLNNFSCPQPITIDKPPSVSNTSTISLKSASDDNLLNKTSEGYKKFTELMPKLNFGGTKYKIKRKYTRKYKKTYKKSRKSRKHY
jgi:hypothetical protein